LWICNDLNKLSRFTAGIADYQASTDEEGFTASGALRMGVSEMTRFGMEEKDFQLLAGLIQEVIINNANIEPSIDSPTPARSGT